MTSTTNSDLKTLHNKDRPTDDAVKCCHNRNASWHLTLESSFELSSCV